MKKIDAGIEYKVYDIWNEKILKVPKNILEIFITHLDWYTELYFHPIKLIKKTIYTYKLREESTKYIFAHVDKSIFGNIEYQGKNIIQDKVIIGKLYIDHNPSRVREYCEKYVQQLFELWKYSCSDIHFNFTLNTWINSRNNLIFVDIGELSFKKKEVSDFIRSQAWLKWYSYLHELSSDAQTVCRAIFWEKITRQNLEKYWWEYK